MTVYVDDMRQRARVGRINGVWCHMFADSTEELVAFAVSIGMNSQWIQHPGTRKEHFDVTEPRRCDAVRLGAIEISYPSDVIGIFDARRKGYVFDLLFWRFEMDMEDS